MPSTSSQTSNHSYLLFKLQKELYALPSSAVLEIVILPKVSKVPNSPPEVRGAINLRGNVIQLIDLRIKLGLPSAQSELDDLLQLLREREQDHHDWLEELEACIREQRTFALARDPHTCRFGRWYDSYQTDSERIKFTLKKMDEPHKIIHATANIALQMASEGNTEAALNLLAERRDRELAGLSRLFEEARRQLQEQHRNLAVVIDRNGQRLALCIDQVEAVEQIPEERTDQLSILLGREGEQENRRIGKRIKTDETIFLLDQDFL